MIQVDMEDIIGNAMYDLCYYTEKREIDNKIIDKYQEAVFQNLREMEIDFLDASSREEWYEFKEYNDYFKVIENEDGYKVKLKDRVTVDDISRYRAYIPIDLAIAFNNNKTKEILGIKEDNKKLRK